MHILHIALLQSIKGSMETAIKATESKLLEREQIRKSKVQCLLLGKGCLVCSGCHDCFSVLMVLVITVVCCGSVVIVFKGVAGC